jgi:hypothetical protein
MVRRSRTTAKEVDRLSSGGQDFFEQAADAIAASLPHAERLTLEGQSHVADPKTVAAVLKRFFTQ